MSPTGIWEGGLPEQAALVMLMAWPLWCPPNQPLVLGLESLQRAGTGAWHLCCCSLVLLVSVTVLYASRIAWALPQSSL